MVVTRKDKFKELAMRKRMRYEQVSEKFSTYQCRGTIGHCILDISLYLEKKNQKEDVIKIV